MRRTRLLLILVTVVIIALGLLSYLGITHIIERDREWYSSFSSLQESYDQLNTGYTELISDYNTLNTSHTLLQAQAEEWNSAYQSLQESYDQLNTGYTELKAKFNAINISHVVHENVRQPDKIVYENGKEYRVVDGHTGDIIDSFLEAGEAINSAIESGDGDHLLFVVCKGLLNVSSQVKLRSNLMIQFDTLNFNGLENEAALLIDDGSRLVHNLWIQGVEINSPYIGIKNAQQDQPHPMLLSYDIHIDVGLIRNARHQALNLQYLQGEIWIDYLRTDNVLGENSGTWLIEIGNIEGLTIGEISLTKPSNYGISLRSINSLWGHSIFADSPGNDGIFLYDIANAYIDRLVAHLCPGTGVILRYPKSVNINQIAASLCGGDGVSIEYTGNFATQIGSIHVNHCGFNKEDGSALRFVGAKYSTIRSLQAIDDYPQPVMKHAVVEDEESNYNQIGQLNSFGLIGETINTKATHSRYPAHGEEPDSIRVGVSPFTYRNFDCYQEDVIVQGGDVLSIEFSRDGFTWYNVGSSSTLFRLAPGDYLRVTYLSPPHMAKIPM